MTIRKKLLLATSLFIASQGQALAAGYSTSLYSTSGLANSYAGSAAGSHDVSDMFFNPATLSDIKTKQFVASVSYLDLKIKPYNTSSAGSYGSRTDDAGRNAMVPAFYFSTPVSKSTTFGLAVTSPFGLATTYNNDWAANQSAIASAIKTININPSVSYKLSDKLAVAVGAQLQYMELVVTRDLFGNSGAFGKTKGNDWGYGYTLGAHYKLNDQVKFGIGYRSKIDHRLEGNTSVNGTRLSGTNANISTPESLTIGGSFKLNPKLELVSDITWTRWSRFKSFIAHQDRPLVAGGDDINTTVFNFQDSFMYSVGANYTLNDKWLLRAGSAYEQGGVRDSSREPRIPASDRIWTSFGFNYKCSKTLSFDAAYMHQFYRMSTIDNPALSTKYKTSVDVISFGVKKDF